MCCPDYYVLQSSWENIQTLLSMFNDLASYHANAAGQKPVQNCSLLNVIDILLANRHTSAGITLPPKMVMQTSLRM